MKSLLRRLGHCDPRKVGTPSLTQCLGCHGGLLWRPDTDLKSRQVLRSSTQMKSVHHSVVSNSATLWTVACQAPPSKNIGVGSHSLLWGIFPTQGLNPDLLLYRQILYHLSHQGSPINIWGTFKNLIHLHLNWLLIYMFLFFFLIYVSIDIF